jgi:putative ABC transport system ATP-binding protein
MEVAERSGLDYQFLAYCLLRNRHPIMRIELDNVVPNPFRERAELDSEIWGRQAVFERPGFYQVWAPSGQGKTTFTHIIYGLRRDYTGTLSIHGNRAPAIAADDWAELRQRHFSIVFQDLRLFPYLTAWENICIKDLLQPYLSQVELRKLCQELSIDGLLDKRCDQISFGEQQRVAVVRAMAQPFEWLLLDEPFSHLDSENVEKVSRLIARQCHLRGAGCLLMTLDQSRQFDSSQTLRL